MRKITLAILLIMSVAMCAFFTACSGEGDVGSQDNTENSTESNNSIGSNNSTGDASNSSSSMGSSSDSSADKEDDATDSSGDNQQGITHTHSFGEWTIITQPSCVEAGMRQRECVCGELENEELPQTEAHNYGENNLCKNCNMPTPSIGLEFSPINLGLAYCVIGIGSCNDSNVVIPTHYNGMPVVKIQENAFANCTQINSIFIPFTVSNIEGGAFFGCDNLKAFYVNAFNLSYSAIDGNLYNKTGTELIQYAIGKAENEFAYPPSVSRVAKGAFQGANNLQRLTVGFAGESFDGDKETHFGYIFGAPDYTTNKKYVSKSLNTVVVRGGNVAENAFFKCHSIKEIVIERGVESIGRGAFMACSFLSKITVPFVGCGGEKSFLDDFFSHSAGTLQEGVPESLKTVVVDGNTSIPMNAFSKCHYLMYIELMPGVTDIGRRAFADCYRLVSVTIPETVTSIHETAFGYVYSLAEIYNLSGQEIVYYAYENQTYIKPTIHTVASAESILSKTSDGYVFTKYNGVNYLIGYEGDSANMVLPDSCNAEPYVINGYAFYECKSAVTVKIGDACRVIGAWAFKNCDNLVKVTLPSSVEDIVSSFEGCDKLYEVYNFSKIDWVSLYNFGKMAYVKNGVTSPTGESCIEITNEGFILFEKGNECYLLGYMGSLENVTLPDKIDGKSYQQVRAFAHNRIVENIILPDNISIGQMFYKCVSLERVDLPSTVTSIENSAFEGCISLMSIEIPSSVVSIGNSAFNGCVSIKAIRLPFSVTTVKGEAFANCVSLKDVEINNPNVILSNNIFSGCVGIESLVAPLLDGRAMGELFDGKYVVNECLKTVVITNGDRIGESAFSDFLALTKIEVLSNVTSIGESAFSGCICLEDFIIPSSVTSIGDRAFFLCKKLSRVVIPDGVTRIGDSTFYDCYSLESVIIPRSVTFIGLCAFGYCESLEKLVIPSGVNSIGQLAFEKCTSLTIYCEAEGQPSAWHSDWNPDPCPIVWGHKQENK